MSEESTGEELTLEEQATNYHTQKHILRVRDLLNVCVRDLLRRGEKHDLSKLEEPELSLFREWTPKLSKMTYGSPEYEAARKALAPALAHHYAKNRHHPEHTKNGILDMNLLDLLEMFCDWKASSERHNDGNIRKSIEINTSRFEMSPQLAKIFENTAALFDE